MLGMKSYPKESIASCRARIKRDMKAYSELPVTAKKLLEHTFFNNLLLALEYSFVHRLAGSEGKDGNPLNEVRVLCNSLVLNGGKVQVERLPNWPMSAVSGLRLPPAKSVLGLKPGDKIALTESDFTRLSDAFFIELEKRFS